jgi:hypothetical protein
MALGFSGKLQRNVSQDKQCFLKTEAVGLSKKFVNYYQTKHLRILEKKYYAKIQPAM